MLGKRTNGQKQGKYKINMNNLMVPGITVILKQKIMEI
jgi:hypothetical protein